MTPQALKRAIADIIDDFCVLNKTVSELREHNSYLESRISEESDCATLLARHNALVDAVKKMLESYKLAEECSCPYCLEDFERERAEVDRLIAEEKR